MICKLFVLRKGDGVAVFLMRACISSEKATVLQVFDMQAVWCCCVSCVCLFVLRTGDGAAGGNVRSGWCAQTDLF